MANVISIALKRDELDRSFGGGIPRSSLVLIEGEDGSGKSILAQRIAFGLLEHNTTVSYISTEMNTIDFINQMNSINYEIQQHLLNDRLMFIPMFPFLGQVKMRDDFMDRLMKAKKIFEKDAIIFDTMSFLLVQDSVKANQSFDIVNFVKKITTLNKILVFCVDPTHLNKDFLSLIRSIADVYIQVEAKMVLGNLLRVASVKRFRRCADDVATAFPFKVEPGNGLAIELASLS
jgi:flagellar protein FlaH